MTEDAKGKFYSRGRINESALPSAVLEMFYKKNTRKKRVPPPFSIIVGCNPSSNL